MSTNTITGTECICVQCKHYDCNPGQFPCAMCEPSSSWPNITRTHYTSKLVSRISDNTKQLKLLF